MKLRHLLLLSSLLVLAPLSFAQKAFRTELPEGTKAINFTLKSNDNNNIKLSELRGQVVFVNFWATWCGPCRQEMPALDALHKRYGKSGVTILGVNSGDSQNEAQKYLNETPVNYPILFDNDKSVTKKYKVSTLPQSVLVDCDGNARFEYASYKPGKEKAFQKDIKKLLVECSI